MTVTKRRSVVMLIEPAMAGQKAHTLAPWLKLCFDNSGRWCCLLATAHTAVVNFLPLGRAGRRMAPAG